MGESCVLADTDQGGRDLLVVRMKCRVCHGQHLDTDQPCPQNAGTEERDDYAKTKQKTCLGEGSLVLDKRSRRVPGPGPIGPHRSDKADSPHGQEEGVAKSEDRRQVGIHAV